MYSKGALRGSQQITPGPGEPPHPTPTSPGTSESRVPWDALGSFLPLEVLRRTTVLHSCFRGCGGRAPVCHCGRVLGGRAARGRPYPEGGSAAAEASGNRRLGGGGAQAPALGAGLACSTLVELEGLKAANLLKNTIETIHFTIIVSISVTFLKVACL